MPLQRECSDDDVVRRDADPPRVRDGGEEPVVEPAPTAEPMTVDAEREPRYEHGVDDARINLVRQPGDRLGYAERVPLAGRLPVVEAKVVTVDTRCEQADTPRS